MHRTFLALTIAALAGFATAGQAHDSATAPSRGHLANLLSAPHGQMMLADLRGKGEEDTECNAWEVNDQGGTNKIYDGKYKIIFGHLRCQSPTGESIDCRKDENTDPPKSHCEDGKGSP